MNIGFWLVAFIVLLFIELITVNLVTIWFAIGALVAMGVSLVTDNLFIQVFVFIIASTVMLIVTKPLIKKFKGTKIIPTNSDRVIGKIGEVTKEITPNEYGEVKVFGNIWTACSDKKIPIGTKVKIHDIDGVKLIVKKEEE